MKEENLNSPLSVFKRVGPTIVKRFRKLGVKTIKDLLFYYPFRYDDFSKIVPISQLKAGETATIKGQIILIANRRSPVKKMIITEAIVSDQSGSIKVVWFNQPFLTKILKPGMKVYLAGQADYYLGTFQLTNPSYEKFKPKTLHTARLVPVYPSTENLTQKQIRWLIKLALPFVRKIEEWLPKEIIKNFNLLPLKQSILQIHFPKNKKILQKAIERLKFDELFLLQLKNHYLKKKLKSQRAPAIKFKEKETKDFVESLNFKLTNAQRKTAWEIIKDLEKNHPMNRLLEGDVGSGKTIVAAIAILNILLNNYQAIVMTPTEILAEQHFKTFTKLFKNFPFKIALLTRTKKTTNFKKKIKKQELLKKISSGEVNLILGTHTLIQEKVEFKNPALVIVDEQHRFGVEQRAKLIKKIKEKPKGNYSPHFLSMTATPIPRSLALTLYGDLDLSIIDEMPPGRKEIITKIVAPHQRKDIYEFIKKEIKNGRQAFVVCPLIDPSDKLGVKAATTEYEKLSKEVFPDIPLGILHGKLKPEEKEKTMREFLEKKIKILVSTSVIEVGIDIPNASIMMIEGAERFGLAQLYQLRGRVGRSPHQAYCFIFIERESEKTRKRLEALIKAKNGFELAEKDLEIRGPGEIYGLKQSGFLNELKIARLTDFNLIKKAKEAVKYIFSQDNELNSFPLIQEKIKEISENIHLE